MDKTTLRVIDIIDGTSVDGPGLRTSIYFAGCDHHCPGCHNPSTWDFRAGRDMSVGEIVEHIVENDFNVTFSGGDPLYQYEALTILARAIKAAGKDNLVLHWFHLRATCIRSALQRITVNHRCACRRAFHPCVE